MKEDEKKMIYSEIENKMNKKIKYIKKLYQATTDGGDSKIFHLKCDNIQNSLVLIKSEGKRRFGGFTPIPWKSEEIWKYKKDPEMKFMKSERSFYIESLQNMGIYGEGFSFGEMSLKTNDRRNATIKCSDEHNNKRTILLYVGKEAYDKALKEYQEKKLTKDINNFIKDYPFCKDFSRNNMLSLFNSVTKINLEK
jgi:hypothetical protein